MYLISFLIYSLSLYFISLITLFKGYMLKPFFNCIIKWIITLYNIKRIFYPLYSIFNFIFNPILNFIINIILFYYLYKIKSLIIIFNYILYL